jgi:hypothetical protein
MRLTMTDEARPSLLPCPKCGRQPDDIFDVTNHCDLFGCGTDCTGMWVVVCGFDIGSGCGFFGEWAETQEKAVAEWNKIERLSALSPGGK